MQFSILSGSVYSTEDLDSSDSISGGSWSSDGVPELKETGTQLLATSGELILHSEANAGVSDLVTDNDIVGARGIGEDDIAPVNVAIESYTNLLGWCSNPPHLHTKYGSVSTESVEDVYRFLVDNTKRAVVFTVKMKDNAIRWVNRMRKTIDALQSRADRLEGRINEAVSRGEGVILLKGNKYAHYLFVNGSLVSDPLAEADRLMNMQLGVSHGILLPFYNAVTKALNILRHIPLEDEDGFQRSLEALIDSYPDFTELSNVARKWVGHYPASHALELSDVNPSKQHWLNRLHEIGKPVLLSKTPDKKELDFIVKTSRNKDIKPMDTKEIGDTVSRIRHVCVNLVNVVKEMESLSEETFDTYKMALETLEKKIKPGNDDPKVSASAGRRAHTLMDVLNRFNRELQGYNKLHVDTSVLTVSYMHSLLWVAEESL